MRAVVLSLGLGCALAGCSALVDVDPGNLGQPTERDEDPVAERDSGSAPDPDYDSGCGDCDDGIACTSDRCADGSCRHEASDDECAEGERCQPAQGCVRERCTEASDCDDGDVCNGVETCDPAAPGANVETGCVAGAALDCSDIVPCTADRCDPRQGCVHEVDDTACADGVECTVDRCDAVEGCKHEPSNQRCDACLIASICDVNLGCLGGIGRSCSDGDPCTGDTCSIELGMCLHEPNPVCSDAPDTCERAEEIQLVEWKAELRGSFASLGATYDTACGQGGGRDAVYKLRVDGVVDIILDTAGSTAKTALAVAPGGCDAQRFGFGCAGPVGGGVNTSRLILHRYDAAVHGSELYILVDGASAAEVGEYVLKVEVYAPSRAECASPLWLSACGTVIGFMDDRQPENAWGQQRGNCQGGFGQRAPEEVLSIPGSSDGDVSLFVSSDAFAPTLYARTVCDSRDNDVQLGCKNSFSTNGQSGSVDFSVALGAGSRASVLVDGGENGGKYTFRCTP
jgi:hypothetical protein